MDIALIRDIVIIAWGAIFIIALFVITIVVVSINNKIKEITSSANRILDKADETAEDIQVITSYVRHEVAKPLVSMASTIQGLCHGIQYFTDKVKKR
jgi:hypothetical protein